MGSLEPPHLGLCCQVQYFFSSPLPKYRKLLLLTWLWPGHGDGCHTLKFYIKSFYVMGKALSGELSYTQTGRSPVAQ